MSKGVGVERVRVQRLRAPVDHLPQATLGRDDRRRPARHRLDGRHPERLVPAAEREHVRGPIRVGKPVVRDVVAERDAVADAERSGELVQRVDLGGLAGGRLRGSHGQHEPRVGDPLEHGGQCPQEQVVSLVVGDTTEGEDEMRVDAEVALERVPRGG